MIPQHQAHHVILGAGLIGCYLGGALIYSEQKVSFIARSHFKKQIQDGFIISDYENNEYALAPISSVFSPNNLLELEGPADVLWLTVKCLALESVIPTIVECVTDRTIIICCQNGVANHKIIQQAFPNNQVIRAMVPFNVTNTIENRFHRGSQGHLVLECEGEASDSIKWLARQLNSALLPTDTTYHMTALQWAKLQLNLGNAVNALADVPVKEMLGNYQYRLLIAKMMRELLQVTEKKQIKLPKIANVPNTWIPNVLSLPNFLFNRVAHSMLAIDPTVKTSTWSDIHAGKMTEIEFINAQVVDTGKQIGVDTPINSQVVALIKRAEQGEKVSADVFYDWVCKVNKHEYKPL